MSVIPTVYNQGTGLIGSTTSGNNVPDNVDDLIVNNTLTVGGVATFNGVVNINNTLNGIDAVFTGTLTTNNLVVTGTFTFTDISVDGDITLNEDDPAVAGLKNRIIFNNIGTISARRDSGLNPQFDLLNNGVSTVDFQIRLNTNSVYFNVPLGGLHRFYVDTVRVLDITGAEVLLLQKLIAPSVGSTANEQFALPASNPTANGKVLAILDYTANPPTTEWVPVGNILDFVRYDRVTFQLRDEGNNNSLIRFLRIGDTSANTGGTLDVIRTDTIPVTGATTSKLFFSDPNVAPLEFSAIVNSTGNGQLIQIDPLNDYILVQNNLQKLLVKSDEFLFGDITGNFNAVVKHQRLDGNLSSTCTFGVPTGGNPYHWVVRHLDPTYAQSEITLATFPANNEIFMEVDNPVSLAYSRLSLERTGIYLEGFPGGVTINTGNNIAPNWVRLPQTSVQPSINDVLAVSIVNAGTKGAPHIMDWVSKDKVYNFASGGVAYFKTINNVTDITADPSFNYDDVTQVMTCPNIVTDDIQTDFIDMANFELNYLQTHNGDNFYITSQIPYSGLGPPAWYIAAVNFSLPGAGVDLKLKPDIIQAELGCGIGNNLKINPTEILCEGNTRIDGDVTITAITNTNNENCRIPFIEGSGSVTGRLCNQGNFYYNPSSTTLVSNNILGINQVATPLVIVQGTATGQINIDPTYGMFFNHADGYVFQMAGVWKMRIANNTTTVFNDLDCTANLDVDGDIEKHTATLSAVNRNQNILFHDNDAGDKRIKENNNFHFNPSTETLTTTNLSATTATVASDGLTYNAAVPTSGGAREMLLLNSNGIIKKADASFQYDPIQQKLTCLNIELNDGAGNGEITVINPIRYGGALFYTMLNGTYTIGPTNTIQTIDPTNVLNQGYYGNNGSIYLGITYSGVNAISYGTNVDLWDWTPYNNTTNVASTWTCQSLIAGLWHIRITFLFQNDATGGSDRFNPIIKMEKNGTLLDYGYMSSYIRFSQGRVGSVVLDIKTDFAFTDTFQLRTYLNRAGVTNFSSVATGSEFTLSDFYFQATFLGPLTAYSRTRP